MIPPTGSVVFLVYPKIAIPLNVRVNSWFTFCRFFQFLRLIWVCVWPRQPPAVFRFDSPLSPLTKRTQSGTRDSIRKSTSLSVQSFPGHFSSFFQCDFQQQFFLKARTRGQRKLFKVSLLQIGIPKKLIRKRTTCVLTLKLDCLKMYQRCGLSLVVTGQNFPFNQLKLHWNVLFFLSFFFSFLFKNCSTLSIQIDAQRGCVCVPSSSCFDHSNETVLVRKIAIRFRRRRSRRMTKKN